MEWYQIVLIVLGVLLLSGIPVMLIVTIPIAKMVFRTQFTRPDVPENGWTRYVCSFPDNEENMEMHRQGMEWADANIAARKEVSISNEGLKLCGQYFDFGFDKAAIFLAGRAEPCTYSYYYAMPYKEYGYNVLVIDNRGTGISDGKYTFAGVKEFSDVQKWIKFLNEELGNKKVIIHGICMGSASGLKAITHEGKPDCVQAIIVDGMFTNFYESLRTHFKELGKPVFPVAPEVAVMFRKLSGYSIISGGPVKDVKQYEGPILMLHGREDKFSLPPKAQKLYDSCPSKNKKLVWFDKGMHSHLKICAPEKYVQVVGDFIRDLK